MLTRIAVNGTVPCIVGTDLNDNPTNSEAVTKATDAEIIEDVVGAAFNGAPPPTYCKGGIQENVRGTGCTRIDTIFVQQHSASCAYVITLCVQ